MNSPDPARPVSMKQKEPEDKLDLNCVESRQQAQMNSPDPARPVSVKQEETEDQPGLNHCVESRLQVKTNSSDSAMDISIKQEEPEDHLQLGTGTRRSNRVRRPRFDLREQAESPCNSRPSQSDHSSDEDGGGGGGDNNDWVPCNRVEDDAWSRRPHCVQMNSPDPARPVSMKQEEPEDQPGLTMPKMKEKTRGGKRGGGPCPSSGPGSCKRTREEDFSSLEEIMALALKKKVLVETDAELSDDEEEHGVPIPSGPSDPVAAMPESGPAEMGVGTGTQHSGKVPRPCFDLREQVESPYNSRLSQSDHSSDEDGGDDEDRVPCNREEDDGLSRRPVPGCGRPGTKLPADPVWKETADWYPQDIPFTAVPGPRAAAADLQSDDPADFLGLFLTDELLDRIVVQTNLYAQQCIDAVGQSALPHARVLSWKPVDRVELKTFLGLHFLTGIVWKPMLAMYWSTEDIVATPYFGQTMSRNRFELIWRFLHFSDNSVNRGDGTDKMFKIRPVLDYIVNKFQEMYQPDKNICIDEGALLFRGRLSFKVNNPEKSVKYGMTSYICCDSETGYCYNIKPYCGENTIVALLGGLLGYGHNLYMDNFYNSVAMCDKLLDLKTHVCGPLRKNRGEPPDINKLTHADLEVGDVIARHNDKVIVLAWRDKKIIRMVSTFHQADMEKVKVRERGHSESVEKERPACSVAYKKSMNGVDKLDQKIAYYPFVRRFHKWTNKFVSYLFEICIFNAFVIYRAKNPQGREKELLSFMKRIITSWTGGEASGDDNPPSAPTPYRDPRIQPQNPRAPRTDPKSRLNGDIASHVLVPIGRGPKGKVAPTKRCRVCSKNNNRRESRYYCKDCKMPLCKLPCFHRYHTEVNYF